MTYTVWSHGQLIGTTNLAFRPVFPLHRMGWFIPNAHGRTLMPEISAGLIALHAWRQRKTAEMHDGAISSSALRDSAYPADVEKAYQRAEALALQLRYEDGSIVPTTDIGIRDTEALLLLSDSLSDADSLDDADSSGDVFEDLMLTDKHEWLNTADDDESTDWALNHDIELVKAHFSNSDTIALAEHTPSENERYQIQVTFVHPPP